MLRLVIAATFLSVLSLPVAAGDAYSDVRSLLINDADAYEDDYVDEEFDKATKDQYDSRRGEKERLADKEWRWFEPVLDRDPFWSGPISHENGDHFHHLNTTWPMEAAATLDKWHFYVRFSAQAFREQYDETDGGDDVKFNATHGLAVFEGYVGLPWRFEIGLKYIAGENLERGQNDTFWFQGRTQIIYDDERDDGSKSAEINLKWNIYKHADGISGFGINLKYKEPLAIRSNLLDTMSREGGGNLIGSLKWGITSWHLNIGYIHADGTRLLFHRTASGDHVELDGFFTGGLAGTIQVWEFIQLIGQIEGHTNAWEDEADELFDEEFMFTVNAGLRVRLGPVVMEGLLGRRLDRQSAQYQGLLAVGVKF